MVSSLFWRYKMKKIRELRADEIEARVGVVRKNGISLLLYKDARCDMNILDETFGITGWKRHHELINGSLFCTVSIRDENGEWISKQDVGVESYTEAVKGAASDSFKRACFNIGIGRELYTAPFIWISSDKVSIAEDNNLNPLHIIKGEKAVLTKSPTAVRDDIVVKAKKTGKVIKRMQLKDTTSKSGIRDTAKKVKDHHYKGTILMGTKETAKKYAEQAAKDPRIKQKMHSNGISSDHTKLIATKFAGTNAKGTSKRLVKESAKTGLGGATFTAGIEAVKAGFDVKNGKKDVKSAVGTVINETAISTASAITGDAIGGAATIAASTLLSGPAAPVVGVVGLAAGAGASKITDKAIRTGETTVLNTYNSGKKKKAKIKRR